MKQNIPPRPLTVPEDTRVYFLRTPHTTLYFREHDGRVSWNGRSTDVPPARLLDFLAIARELGLKAGEL